MGQSQDPLSAMKPGPDAKRTTYQANCHCGAIKYTVTLADALAPEGKGKIISCNCSICTKNGYLLVYPKREDVVFKDDCDSKLKDYKHGKKIRPHRFCPECGNNVLIDFKDADIEAHKPLLAMNARLFKNIDLDKAEYIKVDGWGMISPQYDV